MPVQSGRDADSSRVEYARRHRNRNGHLDAGVRADSDQIERLDRQADSTSSHSSTPESYDVEIPISADLFIMLGRRSQQLGVDTGGVYDDRIMAVAVYDRPWETSLGPGDACLLGMIHVSTRFDRVFRIEVYPENGGTFDKMLSHLERLVGFEDGTVQDEAG